MESSDEREGEPVDSQYLLGQLNTARREIHNLRQQIKSLKHIFEKDVHGIKKMIGLQQGEVSGKPPEPTTSTSQMLDNSGISMTPIGVINTGFPSKRATPRQAGIGKDMCGRITLFNTVLTNPEHALQGLQEFSHMWILFHFHHNDSTHIRAKVAPPRLNGARIGVFSTRSPHRPCPIGLSLVKILEISDNTILFEGVDTVDGTPVLDLKPYIPQYDNPLKVFPNIESNGISSSHLFPSTPSPDPDPQFPQFPTEREICRQPPEDVSGDEELALRLQAEEFSQSSPSLTIPIHQRELNPREGSRNLVHQGELNPPENAEISPGNSFADDDPGNSRLLDGADGPSTVCGTDVDFVNRRLLNLRHDNSPVRMGVREAPDGEEGMETLGAQRADDVPGTFRSGAESLEEADVVRVPDWINQSGSRSLSVTFNERALRQLHEIVNDKAEEQKRAIENVLREDPRSVYLRQRWSNQFYTFLIHDLHISCRFDDSRAVVSVFQVRPAGRICDCGEPEWQCLGHSPVL